MRYACRRAGGLREKPANQLYRTSVVVGPYAVLCTATLSATPLRRTYDAYVRHVLLVPPASVVAFHWLTALCRPRPLATASF